MELREELVGAAVAAVAAAADDVGGGDTRCVFELSRFLCHCCSFF